LQTHGFCPHIVQTFWLLAAPGLAQQLDPHGEVAHELKAAIAATAKVANRYFRVCIENVVSKRGK
jgi:hypothetical protein